AELSSLGCTFYSALTAKPPFPGGTDVQKLIRHQTEKPFPIGELRPGVPLEVTQILGRMLEKRPEDRYPTPRHLADALEAFLGPGRPVPATPGSANFETPPVAETPVPGPLPKAPTPAPVKAPPGPPRTHEPAPLGSRA